jgi:mRNA-degrading endonuclease YafQ of YafQ-DinJ toxin-antitoxin module
MEARRIKNIDYSKKFLKSLEELPESIIAKAEFKETVFKENPFSPSLRTYKLHGKEKESWAFWIDYHYRIKFIFLNDEKVLFLDIGSHKIYK